MSKPTEAGIIYSDGSSKHFHLTAGYKYRDEVELFNDQTNTAKWQDHVYAAALGVVEKNDCRTILDIGCGSGFKLMKYFSGYETLGLELPQYIDTLKGKYPNRQWQPVPGLETEEFFPPADVYVCSDVIEHIRRPDVFMRKLSRSPFRFLVISTPAREILAADGKRDLKGPPDNLHHHFEWTMGEFHKFLTPFLNIQEHSYHYNEEYTQIVIAKQKG